MPKCDLKKFVFRTPFPKNTSGRLLLSQASKIVLFAKWLMAAGFERLIKFYV